MLLIVISYPSYSPVPDRVRDWCVRPLLRATRTQILLDVNLNMFLLCLGAVNAMQDAVILANCLYDMASIHPHDITATFKDYH